MPIIAETHCHTVASGHAFSTIYENILAAKQKGLRFLCITDHGPEMSDAPARSFFRNLPKTVPDLIEGVVVLKGAEANIVDYQGSLDLSERCLSRLDWVIASYHVDCCAPADRMSHTEGYLAIAENPQVDVIGHCGDGRFAFEIEPVVKAFAAYGKIVEINAHSPSIRPGSAELCREIARSCMRYQVPVVCSADAHFMTQVGEVGSSLSLLQEIGFPEELILNNDYERFLAVARQKSGRPLIND